MKNGFSLLEVLISISIGILLATFLMSAVQKARTKGLVTKAEATLAAIETALTLYETDFGDYPHHSGTFGRVLAYLNEPSKDPRWKGPYLRVKERELEKGELLDPWKKPYYYYYPQDRHPTTPFLLYSSGPDVKEGTADDIANW